MTNLFDLHTHTVASGHAYSMLRDNLEEAKNKSLRILGTTDHTEKMPGSCDNMFFSNYRIIKREQGSLILLKGAEANIMDYNGHIDIDPKKFDSLEYVIASLHTPCIESGTVNENTSTIIKVMDIDKVQIIGHPDDSRYPLDYDRLTAAAVKKGILLEVNNSSLSPTGCREGARKNLDEMLDYGKERGLHLVVNSDAHISDSVGDVSYGFELLKEKNYPKELILNFDETPDRLFKFLNIKH